MRMLASFKQVHLTAQPTQPTPPDSPTTPRAGTLMCGPTSSTLTIKASAHAAHPRPPSPSPAPSDALTAELSALDLRDPAQPAVPPPSASRPRIPPCPRPHIPPPPHQPAPRQYSGDNSQYRHTCTTPRHCRYGLRSDVHDSDTGRFLALARVPPLYPGPRRIPHRLLYRDSDEAYVSLYAGSRVPRVKARAVSPAFLDERGRTRRRG